jgi:hypothetical protein
MVEEHIAAVIPLPEGIAYNLPVNIAYHTQIGKEKGVCNFAARGVDVHHRDINAHNIGEFARVGHFGRYADMFPLL